jgi:hypothetical protein
LDAQYAFDCGAFAHAVAALDAHALAGGELEADIEQHLADAIAIFNALEFEERWR